MKNLFIIFCLLSNLAKAQNYPWAKKFINDVINRTNILYMDSVGNTPASVMRDVLARNKKPAFYIYRTDSILYTDGMGKKKILERLPKAKMSDQDNSRYTNIKKDSLVLSDKELNYVLAELGKMRDYKWSDGLLPNSKAISADSLKRIFNTREVKGWDYLNKIGVHAILTISKPVFLRNDTICFFYFGESCGAECGSGELTVYKKVNGEWALWIMLTKWII